MTSVVAAPIVVSGDIWGAVVASVTRDLQFAANAEERLGKFAGLVAVALANAQAREELATLADEQAALSRVAVAAATEQPEQLFNIVTEEVGRLFGGHWASTTRYVEGSDEVELVGRWHRTGNHRLDLGARLPLRGGVLSRVRETGGPARIDYEKEPPAVQDDDPLRRRRRRRRGTDRRLRAPLGGPLDFGGRAGRVRRRRRDASRQVHEPRRRHACQRGGPRAAESIARTHRPGRRRRAAAARTEPSRRRAAAPGLARARAPPRRVAASRRPGSRGGTARAGERRARARSGGAP